MTAIWHGRLQYVNMPISELLPVSHTHTQHIPGNIKRCPYMDSMTCFLPCFGARSQKWHWNDLEWDCWTNLAQIPHKFIFIEQCFDYIWLSQLMEPNLVHQAYHPIRKHTSAFSILFLATSVPRFAWWAPVETTMALGIEVSCPGIPSPGEVHGFFGAPPVVPGFQLRCLRWHGRGCTIGAVWPSRSWGTRKSI